MGGLGVRFFMNEIFMNKIIFKGLCVHKGFKSVFEYIGKVNVAHPISIFYKDTVYSINLNDDYSKIEIYDDFIVCFQMNTLKYNKHEDKYPYNGDGHRIILLDDIKSIQI